MQLVEPELANEAIKLALTGRENPAYAIFLLITSVERLVIAPRRGFTHAFLLKLIRDNLLPDEKPFTFENHEVYDGFIEWDDGEIRVRCSNGRPLPMDRERQLLQLLFNI